MFYQQNLHVKPVRLSFESWNIKRGNNDVNEKEHFYLCQHISI